MFLMASGMVAAQGRRAKAPVDTVPAIVRQYQDSLLIYKARVDSLQQLSEKMNPQLYKLFVPLTFYNDISHKKFSLNADTTALLNTQVDDVLVQVRVLDRTQGTQNVLFVQLHNRSIGRVWVYFSRGKFRLFRKRKRHTPFVYVFYRKRFFQGITKIKS
jgi:hypothetical protein